MTNPFTMIKYALLYTKVKPLVEKLNGELKMKFSFNLLTQILGTAGQILNVVGGVIPQKYQVLTAGLLAGVQSIVGVIAHFQNPDGTSAVLPYTK